MSTGADCIFEEREPGQWWLRLQEYPYGETEDYREHGPFGSEEAAERYLDRNYANPGGYSTVPYAEYAARQERKAARERQRSEEQAAAKVRPGSRPIRIPYGRRMR